MEVKKEMYEHEFFIELLKDTPMYKIMDNGWYYSNTLFICFDFEEAKKKFEEITNEKWSQEKQELAQKTKYNKTGHYYYSIYTETVGDFLKEFKETVELHCKSNFQEELETNTQKTLKSEIKKIEKNHEGKIIKEIVDYLTKNYEKDY